MRHRRAAGGTTDRAVVEHPTFGGLTDHVRHRGQSLRRVTDTSVHRVGCLTDRASRAANPGPSFTGAYPPALRPPTGPRMRGAFVAAHLARRCHRRGIEAGGHRAAGHQSSHQSLLALRQRVVLGHAHTSRAPVVIGAAPAAVAIASNSSNSSAAGGYRPSRSSMNGVSTRCRSAVTRSNTSGGV